ncbi:MAG TPA: hypothetical protein VL404_06100 [Candidatus Eisenbacteria bacterium]|nr:hypothetical protein [Candidatus Eisenbacteria bacterium]
MSGGDIIQTVGTAAGIALPLFNIPLILRLLKRKSSADFSLSWALGVWVCIVLMTPQALRSTDVSFRTYGVVNIIFFSAVVFFVFKYRSRA